jgi:hypothetical protein
VIFRAKFSERHLCVPVSGFRMRVWGITVAIALSLPLSISPVHAATGETWDSLTRIDGDVTIAAGQTVTVAANTVINVKDGAKIIVAGTLIAPSGLVLAGKNWVGMEISGFARLTDFQASGASTTFQITPSGRLEIYGGKISGVKGASIVEGVLVAERLQYDKGDGAGIESGSGKGSISIDQSILTGSGRASGDFFALSGLRSISLTNSQMSGSHCAFHVTGVDTMILKNNYISDNAYGFMMYGSSKSGTRKITRTTITNNAFGFDEGSASTRNGAITISQSYIKGNGKDLGLFTGKVKISDSLLNKPRR